MNVTPHTQEARVLLALADGKPKTAAALHRKAGMSIRINSRISGLREKGYAIEHSTVPGRKGNLAHRYQLVPALTEDELRELAGGVVLGEAIPGENAAPRDLANRYRIYGLVYDDLELYATAPDEPSVGVAICTMGREGQFARACLGVLDALPDGTERDQSGVWIVNPWDTNP